MQQIQVWSLKVEIPMKFNMVVIHLHQLYAPFSIRRHRCLFKESLK